MRLAEIARFDGRSLRWMARLYGLALAIEVVTGIRNGVHRVHTGELYPWRHLPIVPLYPAPVLFVEWAVTIAVAGVLLLGPASIRRQAWRAAAVVTLVALSQRYSNHGALAFIVAAFVALDPPAVDEGRVTSPFLALVRAQLGIVYVFSALNKLLHHWLDGASLANLLGISVMVARPLAFAVIVLELAVPALLVVRPRIGFVALVALHAGFAVALDNVTSFGVTMAAMAITFWPLTASSASPADAP